MMAWLTKKINLEKIIIPWAERRLQEQIHSLSTFPSLLIKEEREGWELLSESEWVPEGLKPMGYSQVNVPQGRDKKMSVDGAKPKVFEDLINRLLSRAEHSFLWVKMWSLDRSWAAAPVLQEPLNDQSHFQLRNVTHFHFRKCWYYDRPC